MALFRRSRAETPDIPDDTPETEPSGVGPWDVADMPERGTRVDLGALWVPLTEGMQLRLEADKASRLITAAAVVHAGSVLHLSVFAAPRSEGIWDEVRAGLAESVTKQGGTAEEVTGPFGRELIARVPVRVEGRSGTRPARFFGVDGPRWFLRGWLTGEAAGSPDKAGPLEAVFRDTVVLRGTAPRAPRDLLALTVPGTTPPPETPPAPSFDPLTRGPEITEIR